MAWFIKSEINLITIYIGIADDIQNTSHSIVYCK